ncbi:MAG TPA: hypothetical protein VM120_17405 [Bryobacteraceae bacterium]|nr:hypothetical protein [Bryobacteraceae bacterium]
MTKFFKIISAAAFSAALIFAQGPGGRGGGPPDPQAMLEQRVAFLTARLGLTDDQKAQATTIYTNAGTAAQSIRTTLQTTHQRFLTP